MRMFLVSAATLATAAGVQAAPLEGKLSSADIIAASTKDDWRALDPENTIYVELEKGRVVIVLSSSLAQNHIANIKELARAKFYDGLTFYRVIDGFVAQGGDLFETKSKTVAPLAAEFESAAPDDLNFYRMKDKDGYAPRAGFIESLPAGYDPKSKRAWHIHCTGAVAMARGDEPDTASTEFYVALQPVRYLDRNMSVIGRVVSGMEHVQALKRVTPAETPDGDLGDKIVTVRVAADVPEAERTTLEILRSDRPAFEAYVESRRNRPEGFFVHRPNYVDLCQLSVPVRPVAE